MRNNWNKMFVCGLVAWTLFSGIAYAAQQDSTAQGQSSERSRDREGNRDERGGERQRFESRGFDMEAMQQRMMERIKEQLNATDAEWKVIEPRLSKVMSLNRQQMMSRMGGGLFMRRPDGERSERPDRPEAQQDNPVRQAQEALQQTVEKKDASAAEIKAKLTALREAREQSKQELAKAQQELRDVLQLRQEAQLVMIGMLD